MRAFAYLILSFAAFTLLLWALSYDRGVLVMQYYTAPLALVFFGMSLHSGTYRKRNVYWLGIIFVGWFILSRILNGELYLQNSWWHASGLCVTYLLAFPFAFSLDDSIRRRGLTVAAGIFSVAYALLAWISLIGMLRSKNIILPYLESELGVEQFRLYANQHPNGSAILFLIGLMLTLYLLFQYRKRWMILPAVIMILGFYLGIALTVSRTVMVELSLGMGVLIAMYCLKRTFRYRWMRFAVTAVAFIAVVGITYASFDYAVDGMTALQHKEWISSANAQTVTEATSTPDPQIDVVRRPLSKDVSTLTGRTEIWEAAIMLMKGRPKTLFVGLLNSELLSELKNYVTIPADHAHNAWLQTLLNMGLPGLALAIWFTLLSLRCAWRILLRYSDKTTWAEKIMTLLPLLLLVNSLTESVLFMEMFSYGNVIFFLTLGYMLELEKRIAPKTKKLKA